MNSCCISKTSESRTNSVEFVLYLQDACASIGEQPRSAGPGRTSITHRPRSGPQVARARPDTPRTGPRSSTVSSLRVVAPAALSSAVQDHKNSLTRVSRRFIFRRACACPLSRAAPAGPRLSPPGRSERPSAACTSPVRSLPRLAALLVEIGHVPYYRAPCPSRVQAMLAESLG